MCLLSYWNNGDEQRPRNHNENEMNINHNNECDGENDISAQMSIFLLEMITKPTRLNRLLRVFFYFSSRISAANEVQRSLIYMPAQTFICVRNTQFYEHDCIFSFIFSFSLWFRWHFRACTKDFDISAIRLRLLFQSTLIVSYFSSTMKSFKCWRKCSLDEMDHDRNCT